MRLPHSIPEFKRRLKGSKMVEMKVFGLFDASEVRAKGRGVGVRGIGVSELGQLGGFD